MEFSDWLQEQLNKRQWGQNDLRSRMGDVKISQGQLSRIMTGIRQAGPEACIAIAEAFGLSREEVFRARGWLLSKSEKEPQIKFSPEASEVAAKIDQLSSQSRQVALRIANTTADALREAGEAGGR